MMIMILIYCITIILVIFAVGDRFMTMMMLMFEMVRVVNGP